jgi:hypothetical protein
MSTAHIGGVPAQTPRSSLIKSRAYFVTVAGFTFEFVSLDQVREALSYFEQDSRPPNRQPGVVLEHYWQRWFERLPQWLFDERRRVKVVEALRKALAEFETDPRHAI